MRRVVFAGLIALILAPACRPGIDARLASGQGRGRTSPVAQELVDYLEQSRGMTFNARYAARSSDPEISSANLVIEVWRKPPFVRQDTSTTQQGSQTQTVTIGRTDDVVHCTREGNDPWVCRSMPRASASGFDDLLEQVRTEVAGAIVTQKSAQVAGRASSCYNVVRPGAESSEVCVEDQGIPVRISTEGAAMKLELTSLNMRVNDSVFEPPAAVG